MNKFPDKEDIVNLTNDEIDELKTLIDNTIFVELKKLCKKYELKCTSLKVKELRVYLKTIIELQHQGKFEYTSGAFKAKKLPELKKIMEENNIKFAKGDKKDDFVKKIVRHFKSSKSRSKSPSPKWGIKFKSPKKVPKTKNRIAIKHKFKKGDRVFIFEIDEYGKIMNYDSENKLYNVLTDNEKSLEIGEDELKQVSQKVSPPRLQAGYYAETIPDIEPPQLYTGYSAPPQLYTGYSTETVISPPSPVKQPSKYAHIKSGYENIKPIENLPEIDHELDQVKQPSKYAHIKSGYENTETLPEPVKEPWYIEEEESTIDEYEQPILEEEIIEDTERINIEDIEGVLSELQTISVDDILDNNVRIKKTIQKYLSLGLM